MPPKLRFYGYKKCSTCRKAEQYLKQEGRDYEYIDITVSPPKPEELMLWMQSQRYPSSAFFNSSGRVYQELQLSKTFASLSLADKVELLAKHGKLVKRPLITDGVNLSLGAQSEQLGLWQNPEKGDRA